MRGDPTLAREDRSGTATYVSALLAGLVAAVAGGIAWGLIVKWTDYEVGLVAWGIGFVGGIAVLAATRGGRGRGFQAAAVLCALVGILVGKYLSFIWGLRNIAENEGAGGVVPAVLSADGIELFFENFDFVFDLIDLLWVGLAVFTAWRTLQPEEPERVEAPPESKPPAESAP